MSAQVPDTLRLNAEHNQLTICYDDKSYELSAEYLRVCSPSAEVRAHGGEWNIIGGKKSVRIDLIRPVGQYAVRLVFSDGHFSGIYSWEILEDLIQNEKAYWQNYLQRLEALGKTREQA